MSRRQREETSLEFNELVSLFDSQIENQRKLAAKMEEFHRILKVKKLENPPEIQEEKRTEEKINSSGSEASSDDDEGKQKIDI